MITDPVFYRLFATSPETFFLMLGMPVDTAREMAARYQYEAIEVKSTSHRLDGVFQPKEPGLPIYFVEVQFYDLPSVYAGLLAKAYTYLKQHDPAQPFCGVVLFGSRAFEPKDVTPYRPLLDSGMVRVFYLDEMPEPSEAPIGLSIIYLLRELDDRAPNTARELIERAKREIGDEALRSDLIELIETVIIYKLTHLSREEVRAMLQFHDIKETRVYQEGVEDGIKKGRQRQRQLQRQEKLRVIPKMAASNLSAEDIAEFLGLDIKVVRREMAKKRS